MDQRPSESPTLTPEVAWAQYDGLPLSHFGARLLAVRGWFLSLGAPDRNDLGMYDDAIFVLDGPHIAHGFRASVDPADAYVKKPINPAGCAQLYPGLHWFAIGKHRGENPCFVQHGDVLVNRLARDGSIIRREDGDFAIQIHPGWGSVEDMGRSSAGCQCIFDPAGWNGSAWNKFFTLATSAMWAYTQPIIPYLLIEAIRPEAAAI